MKTILCSFIFFSISVCLNAQSGTLDSSFGMNGKVITDFGIYGGQFFGAAAQKDGKLLAVGSGSIKVNGKILHGFLVVRYLQNGLLDSSFGNNGIIITPFGNGGGTAHDIVGQDDEKFVVAGNGNSFQQRPINNVLLARYNKDGTQDSSFGINGLVITDFGTNETIQAITLQKDEKFIVCGSSNGQDYFTARYNYNGSVDSTFGINGQVITPMGLASASAIAVQSDGKIVEVGNKDGGEKAVVIRYLTNGALDTSFANSGIIADDFGYEGTRFNAVAVKPDGTILAAGQTSGINGNMLVISFTNSGKLNTVFGIAAKKTIAFDDPSKVVSINLCNNKIILSGNTFGVLNGTRDNFAVCRLFENGNIDSSFGNDGKTVTDFNTSFYEYAVKGLLTNEKIVLFGNTGNYDPPSGIFLLIARYNNNDLSNKQIIINKIKHYISTHNNADAATLNNNITLYPNPVQNILTIKGLSSINNYQLIINNSKGSVVATKQVSNVASYQFNVQNLSSGVYYVSVVVNTKLITTLKFVKQ
jgi:uncharacterized delta-60 repeat protein